jgi:deoxyinosine 3'endonuclease (endonuclease V)
MIGEVYPVSIKMRGAEVILSPEEMAAVVSSMRRTVKAYSHDPLITGTREFQNVLNVLQKLADEVDPAFMDGLGVTRD